VSERDAGAAERATAGAAAIDPERRPLPTTVDSPTDLPGVHVYRPRDLDRVKGRLPVVVWANGGCMRNDAIWAQMLERWAAVGIVVIAFTTAPDGGSGPPTTPEEQGALIDWAEQQHRGAGGTFEGRLDLTRVAAAGNSCGGVTSVQLAGSDRRVAAVFVLSGSGSFPGTPIDQANAVMARVRVPIAYVVGGPEDHARANALQDFGGLAARVPGYVAQRNAGDHVALSSTPSILLDEVAPIGIDWFALAFDGNRAARARLVDDPCPTCAPGTWTVESKNLGSLVTPARPR
jgi:hypothetical protein